MSPNKHPQGAISPSLFRGEGLSLNLGGTKIWDSVNFDIQSGMRLGVIGESGCGKSSLLRVMAGLLEPESGELYFSGRKVWPVSAQELHSNEYRRSVCMIAQDGGLFPNISVKQNLDIVNYTQKNDEKLSEVMQTFGLTNNLLSRYPEELSGGQRQRVAIARTALIEPEIILLDEPTSNLDPIAARTVRSTINGLSNDLTVVVASHDIDLIKRICTHVMFIANKGVAHTADISSFFNKIDIKELKEFIEAYE